jgi:GT2 family glycosyltransferase
MNSVLTISFVIVSWNAKQHLANCLKSLPHDLGKYSMEVFVVDNASTDGSPEFVAEKFPHFRLIRNESNLGFSKANNIAIQQSSGKYVCLLNSDVEILGECISKLLEFLDSHPEAGMVGPRIQGSDGRLQRSCRGFPGVWNMFCRALALDVLFPNWRIFGGYLLPYWKHNSLKTVDILSGCFWIVRRKALATVGLLDETFFIYGEDMDWCKRFWENGWPIVFIPDAEVVHHGGASSANAPVPMFIEKQRADLQYWQKHRGPLAQYCYFVISCLHQFLRVAGHASAAWAKGGDSKENRSKVARGVQCLRWLLSHRTRFDGNEQVLRKEEVYAGRLVRPDQRLP